MKRAALSLLVLSLLLPQASSAQDVLDQVFLFRNFNQDARVASRAYLEPYAQHNTYESVTHTSVGLQGGIPFSPRFEAAFGVSYFRDDSDFFESSSGLADIFLHGKYNFSLNATRLSTGAFVTLPIGSEDIGEGDLDAGIFISARHPLSERTVLAGKLSGDYFEFTKDDRDPSLRFHGGVIQMVSDRAAIVGELLVTTSVDVTQLSGGVDYALGPAGRLRGSIAAGLTDNAPDFSFLVGYLIAFGN